MLLVSGRLSLICFMQPVDMLINHLDFFRFWMFLGWLVDRDDTSDLGV